jgi:bifunctional enzyme CysN/CysC
MVCWMTEGSHCTPQKLLDQAHDPLRPRARRGPATYRLDINTLHRDESATSLGLNEIGRVTLRTTTPLFFDEYRRNRQTGSFILIDEAKGCPGPANGRP